ncbi:unnamed protein product [Bemisia tabaci]|uniref:Major facilitator superfamily (MFS) profile domain-containing protein n=2 Tax=Bemisia tabaci TaxID=7038 RepID=A0A9P0C9R0_BEMTA|nr:unnamed protein product [Bemisia tabaci]
MAGEPEIITWSCWLRTVVAGITALFLLAFAGMNNGASNLLLSQLTKKDSLIPISQDQESWVASLGLLAAPIAPILIGPFIDFFGRKKGVLVFYLIMGIGWAVIGSAKNVTQLYIGRMICSFGEGFEACAVVYLAEICATEQRSIVLAWLRALFSAGVLLVEVINTCVSWPVACLGFSLAAFAFAIAELFVPESPAWLFRQGKEEAAVKNLQRLGRSQAGVHLEIETLRQRESSTESLSWRTFLKPTVWKPFVILAVFHVIQLSTGCDVIIFYQVDFLASLGTTYDPVSVSVALSTVRFLSNITVGVYTNSISRKLSTAISGFCMAVPLAGAVIYEYHYRCVPCDRPVQWLPLTFIFAYLVAAEFAVNCLPGTMVGELYPLSVRGTMSGATHFAAHCSYFAYVKFYFACLRVLKIHGILFVFAASSFLAGLFGIYILPETHGKSLVEVERGFEGKTQEIDQNIVVPLSSINS